MFISNVLTPLVAKIEYELSRGLSKEITIDISHLIQSDIAARARAFGSLVKGGMAMEQAAAVSGVLNESGDK